MSSLLCSIFSLMFFFMNYCLQPSDVYFSFFIIFSSFIEMNYWKIVLFILMGLDINNDDKNRF